MFFFTQSDCIWRFHLVKCKAVIWSENHPLSGRIPAFPQLLVWVPKAFWCWQFTLKLFGSSHQSPPNELNKAPGPNISRGSQGETPSPEGFKVHATSESSLRVRTEWGEIHHFIRWGNWSVLRATFAGGSPWGLGRGTPDNYIIGYIIGPALNYRTIYIIIIIVIALLQQLGGQQGQNPIFSGTELVNTEWPYPTWWLPSFKGVENRFLLKSAPFCLFLLPPCSSARDLTLTAAQHCLN